MKILSLHSDSLTVEVKKKAIKGAEEVTEKKQEHKECLTIFTAVEKSDESNPKQAAQHLTNEIKKIAEQLKEKTIVLYPYAHLSSNLSKPDIAVQVLKEAEELLKKDGYKVTRAPFGYYKAFNIATKGHPLSELSRSFTVEETKETTGDYDYKEILKEISKTKLDKENLKENDHRILGKNLDLFSFSEVAPGMIFWHDKGLIIYEELIEYWKEEHRKEDYQLIRTPQIMDAKLWKVSGHWEKYKENNFTTSYSDRPFLVKPMNCPGGMIVYKNTPKTYKDLPLRVGEIGLVHRTELSGVLSGLFRLVQFTQDDAHIFCADEKQVEEEITALIKLINKFYKKFNLEFDHIELSTRPEKRIGDDKTWDIAEQTLEKVLKKEKMKYQVNGGDGAFYGPKIDFHVKDSLGRTWQLSTIQLDFSMPERFDLEFTDNKDKKQRPIMLHRVIYGSIERFIGILLEHSNGNLPLWLSPLQARVINFTDKNEKAAKDYAKKLKEAGIRVDLDLESKTIQNKVRKAELQKVPRIIVIGDKEEESKTISVRRKGKKPEFKVNPEDFIKEMQEEISERK